jgi:hypothetical protein
MEQTLLPSAIAPLTLPVWGEPVNLALAFGLVCGWAIAKKLYSGN